MNNKRIDKKGYRVLAIVWTLAAASMAVAFVRRLAEFNLLLLLLLALSTLTASNFWKAYRRAPEVGGPSPLDAPPRPSTPLDSGRLPLGVELFADDEPTNHSNKDSEENTHE